MGKFERKQQFCDFLQSFNDMPLRVEKEHNKIPPIHKFILTYFGLCFIEGYRILQKIEDSIFLMSRFQYQFSNAQPQQSEQPIQAKCIYKIICMEFTEELNENRLLRISLFDKIKSIIGFMAKDEPGDRFEHLEVDFVFVDNHKFSVISHEHLNSYQTLSLTDFYKRDYGYRGKVNGCRRFYEREQGTKLHELIELYLKGQGKIHNPSHLQKNVFHHCKFNYAINNVLNTICLIIGIEVLENGFETLSCEKWMRKVTKRKFKKFDLLLRNTQKVRVIDWKFSKYSASNRINAKCYARNNREYLQLARKEYNAPVSLKFYCFHQKKDRRDGHYHQFSSAEFSYDAEQVQIDSDIQFTIDSNPDSNLSYSIDEIAVSEENCPNSEKGNKIDTSGPSGRASLKLTMKKSQSSYIRKRMRVDFKDNYNCEIDVVEPTVLVGSLEPENETLINQQRSQCSKQLQSNKSKKSSAKSKQRHRQKDISIEKDVINLQIEDQVPERSEQARHFEEQQPLKQQSGTQQMVEQSFAGNCIGRPQQTLSISQNNPNNIIEIDSDDQGPSPIYRSQTSALFLLHSSTTEPQILESEIKQGLTYGNTQNRHSNNSEGYKQTNKEHKYMIID